MRLPAATDLKTRTGDISKDARTRNAVIETRGDASVVRSRPGILGAEATGLGLYSQGGMQFGDVLYTVNDDDVYFFSSGFILLGGYNLVTGGSFSAYSSATAYNLGDLVYFQDPDTGEVAPWYAYSPLAGIPPSTDPTKPGYWLWSKTPPVNNWYWKALLGVDAGTQVNGFGSCAAATQGYLTAHPVENYTYTTTGCRSYDYVYFNNPPVSTSLSVLVVEMNYSPI